MKLTNLVPRSTRLLVVALFAVFGMLAASCGDDSDAPSSSASSSAESSSDPDGGLSGSLMITGSSTVEPVTNLLAEAFSELHPDVAFSVSGPGSGDGHKACLLYTSPSPRD